MLNKQRWIQGPRIPNKLSGNTDLNCVQALNSTTVIFISKDSAVSYFDFKTWKWTWSDIRILPDFYDIGFGMISCAMTHTKLGEMLVYIMEFELILPDAYFIIRLDINTLEGITIHFFQ